MTLAEGGWMSKADRISGLFWLVFGVIVSIESHRMRLGTLHRPGPGFLFFWVGIALAIMSLVILIRAWLTPKVAGAGGFSFGKKNIAKIILVLISLFLYALLMEKLGFIVVTLLLFIFLLGIVEKKKWGFTIFTSLAVTAAAYLLFDTALHSQLPKGLLGFLRF
jgi:putative tricarboxylic transport membrane protein